MKQHLLSSRQVICGLTIAFVAAAAAHAQESSDRRSQRLKRAQQSMKATDRAAGNFVDSLFSPEVPAGTSKSSTAPRSRATAKSSRSWRGRLVSNPNTQDGSPPYVLLDGQGKVKRFVEPSRQIDLDEYLGEVVTVRRDTGTTLLASQLELPNLELLRTASGEEIDGELSELELAQYEESVPSGSRLDPVYLDDGLNFSGGPSMGGCVGCGDAVCSKPGCGFGSRPVFYVRGEYLNWWLEGMNTPDLVSEILPGPPVTEQVLYGGDRILEDGRDGYRITAGYWFDDYGKWGIEGDYLDLGTLNETFSAGSRDGVFNGRVIVRPFNFAAPFGGNAAGDRGFEDVETPDLDGSVTVDSYSEFQSAGIRFRHGICCKESCDVGCGDAVGGCDMCAGGCDSCTSCGAGVGGATDWLPGVKRIDFLWGLRWADLNEGLHVTEDLQSLPLPADEAFLVRDMFDTENQFFGAELGFQWEWQHRRWSLDLLSKLAIGNTEQRVSIAGSTLIDNSPPAEPGGLLALPSNIGDYQRDQFSILPELGAKLGYQWNDRMRLTVGYTFLYWSNVVRPGDQIDTLIDANQVRRLNATPVVGASPQFRFVETGLWVQGLDLGVDYRW